MTDWADIQPSSRAEKAASARLPAAAVPAQQDNDANSSRNTGGAASPLRMLTVLAGAIMRIRCLADNSTTPGKIEAVMLNSECGKIMDSIQKPS
jgi:hypothetical protein